MMALGASLFVLLALCNPVSPLRLGLARMQVSGSSQPERRPQVAQAPPDVSQAATSIGPTTTLDSEPATANGPAQFEWFRAWYPVHVVDTMDLNTPHKVSLLGLSLVAWNDGPVVAGRKQPGAWRVFEDACPHRLGPLSEGRVESDGSLLCSYHGWRFDGDGKCCDLPWQSEERRGRQGRSCRAQCRAFPTRVLDGLLWVFPRSGPNALEEAAQVDLPVISELHDPATAGRWEWKIPAGVRDFPCGWDGMVENTLDPAHFCAAHHGTLGNRYTDPQPYAFRTTRTLDTETGFEVDGDFGTLAFVPPCLVKYTPRYAGMPFNGSLVLATYCVPTRPGWVRPLANVLVDRDAQLGDTLAERALGIFFSRWTPTWLGHVLSSIVLHQDAGLLYGQYRNLRERGYGGTPRPPALAPADGAGAPPPAQQAVAAPVEAPVQYEQLVHCPTSVDLGVLTFRRWLRTRAGGGVPWACEDALPSRGSEDVFDMWEAHTANCR